MGRSGRSMSDVWKKIENADFGRTPKELKGERWDSVTDLPDNE